MSTLICRHIKTNGARCGTPALRGEVFCYFHNNAARRHQSLRPSPGEPAILHPLSCDHRDPAQRDPILAEYFGPHPSRNLAELDFPPLEDRESIQLALSVVICALAQNRIDAKRANPLIYGLQVASANARSLDYSPSRNELVRETVSTPHGVEIAPDEDNQAEINRREFLEAFEAEEAARALDEEDEDDEDDENDQDNQDSATNRYLRKSLADAL